LFIAVGGALGAVSRFVMASWVARVFGGSFPYGILSVNVVGSFLMGLAMVWVLHRSGDSRMGPLLMTGFLGGFTTFSAFSLDAVMLIEKGRIGAAAAYVGGSVGLSILALAAGLVLARGVWS
jgi:CrcB protein